MTEEAGSLHPLLLLRSHISRDRQGKDKAQISSYGRFVTHNREAMRCGEVETNSDSTFNEI